MAMELSERTLGAAGALSLPLRADALNFGLAGVLGILAAVAWAYAHAALQRLPQPLG
jgi:hypothetical protein